MPELERIIVILEKILKYQQTALNRSAYDQSVLCTKEVKRPPETDDPRNWLSP
jgi:hypothetical protein